MNSSRNQSVAHLWERKNAQHRHGRELEQLPATLPFKILVCETSDHAGPSGKTPSVETGLAPSHCVPRHGIRASTGNQAPNEQTLAHNAMRKRELSFKVGAGLSSLLVGRQSFGVRGIKVGANGTQFATILFDVATIPVSLK